MECRRIGFALDFSAGSQYALKWALENMVKEGDHLIAVIVNKTKINEVGEMHLWEDTGSPLVPVSDFLDPAIACKYGVTHDVQPFSFLQEEEKHRKIVVLFKVYWGDAREKLCDAVVDIPLDCIVMGSRGLGTLKRAVLGSVSNYVVNNAPCPVTVVKQPVDVPAFEDGGK
ncbi:hypothetical protein KP509_14G013200 [Ceratopteris richardii]|uniref:UspA domain-containing protein n=1 Tax=Ceratopteris richardii TaxID=49495 RepID=A0A8T2TAE0_CERRI|nr:hypothetical protein KP509_14G013200 [Ceratopteris richardii]